MRYGGYIFTYLITKSVRFEIFMAIDNVFEKIFDSVRKSKKVLILVIFGRLVLAVKLNK